MIKKKRLNLSWKKIQATRKVKNSAGKIPSVEVWFYGCFIVSTFGNH